MRLTARGTACRMLAREATLLQRHGYDLGHERGGRLYFGLRNKRRVHSRHGIMHEASSRDV